MKIVFFGSSEFSIKPLKKIKDKHEVLVVTKPDKPKGRGLKITPNVLKKFAIQEHCTCIDDENLESIKEYGADVFVVASYGRIIPKHILDIFTIGFNIHPSLLPKFRGPAPIQWAILNGDKKTGVTICKVTENIDGGDIIVQKEIEIDQNDTYESLSDKLSQMGSDMILELLDNFGKIGKFIKQDEKSATWARIIKKEDGKIKWNNDSFQIWRMTRALFPYPKVRTAINGVNTIIHTVSPTDKITNCEPGTIVNISEDGIEVSTGKGTIIIKEIQREGGRRIRGYDFANGMRLVKGDRFESLD